ncbi:hypothetical protein [Mycolicibacterium mucogenicum]|jgi:hypothetical protein|uniref:hypothetical protein n=1 Tax=Mycolicibacterium mucogenicum TaxID=56689 RepID=UPI00076A7FE6|nr:hypothetical protein [Mycolicibacterium mucogenicum]
MITTTVLAAGDPGAIINNILSYVRGFGAGLIVLAGSGHILKKVVGREFTLQHMGRVVIICCCGAALFLMLPQIVQMFVGWAGNGTGFQTNVR